MGGMGGLDAGKFGKSDRPKVPKIDRSDPAPIYGDDDGDAERNPDGTLKYASAIPPREYPPNAEHNNDIALHIWKAKYPEANDNPTTLAYRVHRLRGKILEEKSSEFKSIEAAAKTLKDTLPDASLMRDYSDYIRPNLLGEDRFSTGGMGKRANLDTHEGLTEAQIHLRNVNERTYRLDQIKRWLDDTIRSKETGKLN